MVHFTLALFETDTLDITGRTRKDSGIPWNPGRLKYSAIFDRVGQSRSHQSNIDQKEVTALGVALRKLSGGTNLSEVETLKINCEVNELSRCDDENCCVVEK